MVPASSSRWLFTGYLLFIQTTTGNLASERYATSWNAETVNGLGHLALCLRFPRGFKRPMVPWSSLHPQSCTLRSSANTVFLKSVAPDLNPQMKMVNSKWMMLSRERSTRAGCLFDYLLFTRVYLKGRELQKQCERNSPLSDLLPQCPQLPRLNQTKARNLELSSRLLRRAQVHDTWIIICCLRGHTLARSWN